MMLHPPYYFTNNKKIEVSGRVVGIYCLYYLILIVYCVLIVLYSFKAKNDFGSQTIDYFLLLENWRQPIITDLKIVSNTTSCPDGYQSLNPYRWGGSSHGCNCIDALYIKKKAEGWSDIISGYCTVDQLLYGCSNIETTSSRDMPLWYDSMLLCGKAEKDETFEKRASLMESTGSCANGYQKCGSGDGFSEDRAFCTAASKCPINSIVLSQTSPGANYQESVSFKTKKGDGYSLYWSRLEKNTLPIVEWRVSEENICLNNENNYLSSKHSEYKLVNKERVRCTELDNRFQMADSLTEKEFFTYNNFKNIVNLLPGYSLSDDISWNLYFRSIIDFKIDCRYMMNDLINLEDEATTIKDFIYKSAIISASLVGFLVFGYIIIFFALLNEEKIEGCRENGIKISNIICFLLNYLVRIISISISIVSKTQVTNFANLFSSMKNANCSDELTNAFFTNLSTDLNSSVMFDLNLVVFWNVGIISIDVLTLLISYFSIKFPGTFGSFFKENKKENQNNDNNNHEDPKNIEISNVN